MEFGIEVLLNPFGVMFSKSQIDRWIFRICFSNCDNFMIVWRPTYIIILLLTFCCFRGWWITDIGNHGFCTTTVASVITLQDVAWLQRLLTSCCWSFNNIQIQTMMVLENKRLIGLLGYFKRKKSTLGVHTHTNFVETTIPLAFL